MGSFKLYECDTGIEVNNIKYDFPNVSVVTFEDGERNKLTRGSNATDEVGLTYREGIREPKRILPSIMQMDADMYALFVGLYKNQTRFTYFCVSRKDGSSKMGKNCILSNLPQQLTLDDSAESLDIAIEIETFKIDEVHKS